MTFESEALREGHTLVFGSKEFDQVPLIVYAGVKQDIDSGKGFIESGFQADDATDGRALLSTKKRNHQMCCHKIPSQITT